jgi:raffinose/stachyose/melibiose transport system permease protein/N-acetylglucosamine transport system permease protein
MHTTKEPTKIRERLGSSLGTVIFDYFSSGLLYLWIFFSLFSFAWIIVTSFKNNREFFANVWALPNALEWGNYIKAWSLSNLGQNFFNSIAVVFSSIVILLLIATPAAYILSRIRFRGSGAIASFFTVGMGVPPQLLLVPLFFLMFSMRLVDSLFGIVLVYVALSIPFTIFLLLGFFKTLPTELEEAASIDGCSPFGTFIKVMLPLASPGIVTAAIFNFVFLWNEFLMALTLLSSNQYYTVSLGLSALQGTMNYTGDWVGLFAGFTIVMLPSLLVYIVLSRQIIEGLTMGATKG